MLNSSTRFGNMSKNMGIFRHMTWDIIEGDCLEVMKSFPENHFSCIVTDPPYGLHFMGKDWDSYAKGKVKVGRKILGTHTNSEAHEAARYDGRRDDEFERFMFGTATETLRILKPGGHVLMFGAPRRYHRQVCALEDAGFEIRDCIMWVFGSGFPKSHNRFGISGFGTSLKPSYEPIIMAMKPLDGTFAQNAEKWGQAGINIAATRVPVSDSESTLEPLNQRIVSFSSIESYRDGLACISSVLRAYSNSDKDHLRNVLFRNGNLLSVSECENLLNLLYSNGVWCGLNWKEVPSFQVDCPAYSRLRDELIPNVLKNAPISAPLLGDALDDIYQWIFSHTNNHLWRCNDLLSIEDVSALLHALIDPLFNPTLYLSQQKKSSGRWPANIMFDEEAAKMLDEQSGERKGSSLGTIYKTPRYIGNSYANGKVGGIQKEFGFGDSGGASRFFYCAKTSRRERNEGLDGFSIRQTTGGGGMNNTEDNVCGKYGSIKAPSKNHHPTVKPLHLMEYLIKLVMPPQNGLLLDPFAGSGSTILAAKRLGFNAVGIEKQPEYAEIARARVNSYKDENDTQMDMFEKTEG